MVTLFANGHLVRLRWDLLTGAIDEACKNKLAVEAPSIVLWQQQVVVQECDAMQSKAVMVRHDLIPCWACLKDTY